MNNNDLDNAEIWLRQVVKGELADKETIKAIKVVLDKLERLKQNVKDVRHVAFEEGYSQGFIQGVQGVIELKEAKNEN